MALLDNSVIAVVKELGALGLLGIIIWYSLDASARRDVRIAEFAAAQIEAQKSLVRQLEFISHQCGGVPRRLHDPPLTNAPR